MPNTPIIVDQEYLNWSFFKSNCLTYKQHLYKGMISICSPMGSGKTKILANISSLAKKQKLKVLALSSRVTLARKLSLDLDLNLYSDDIEYITQDNLDEYCIVINSLNSKLEKFEKLSHDFKDYVIIIDEAVQLLHNLSSGIIDSYNTIINIEQMIKNAHTVVLADAHLNQNVIDIFDSMRTIDYENIKLDSYKKNQPVINFLSPNISIEQRTKYTINRKDHNFNLTNITREHNKKFIEMNYEDAISSLFNDITIGTKIYIASDSKEEAEMIRGFIYAHFERNFIPNALMMSPLRVLLITADNSKSKEVLDLLDDPNELKKYDIVICSPAVSTGISIDGDQLSSISKTFKVIYGFFRGSSIHYMDMLQMLFRVRDTKEIKFAFIQDIAYNGGVRQYYTEKEVKCNLDSNARITNVLLGQIPIKLNLGETHYYSAYDGKISMPEFDKIYSKMKIDDNFNIKTNKYMPNELSVFLVHKYYVNEMRKSYSTPSYQFRNFILSQNHEYIINIDQNNIPNELLTMYSSDLTKQNYIRSICNKVVINKNQTQFNINSIELPQYRKAWKLVYFEIFRIQYIQNTVIPSGFDINKTDLSDPTQMGYRKAHIINSLKVNSHPDIDVLTTILDNTDKLEHTLLHLYYLAGTYLQDKSKLSIKCQLYCTLVPILTQMSDWNEQSLNNNQQITYFLINHENMIASAFSKNNITTQKVPIINGILKFGLLSSMKSTNNNNHCHKQTNNIKYKDILSLILTWNNTNIKLGIKLLTKFHKDSYLSRDRLL